MGWGRKLPGEGEEKAQALLPGHAMRPAAKPGYQERDKYILKNFVFQSIFSLGLLPAIEKAVSESETVFLFLPIE